MLLISQQKNNKNHKSQKITYNYILKTANKLGINWKEGITLLEYEALINELECACGRT